MLSYGNSSVIYIWKHFLLIAAPGLQHTIIVLAYRPIPAKFYSTLLQAETWETDTISANLVLDQPNNRHKIEGEKTEVHIDAGPALKIYVPRDMDDREFCFNSKLAPRLTEWLMTNELGKRTEKYDEHAVLVTQSVISSKNKQRGLSRILDHAGIVSVDIPNEIQDTGQSDRERCIPILPSTQGGSEINRDSTLALLSFNKVQRTQHVRA